MPLPIFVDINEISDANVLGELLRNLTFAPGDFGCYSTFDVRDGVTPVSGPITEDSWFFQAMATHCGSKEYIEEFFSAGQLYKLRANDEIYVGWHWDGDGTLAFFFKDRFLLENSDCKKNYGWTIHSLDPECIIDADTNAVEFTDEEIARALAHPLYGDAHALYIACQAVLAATKFDVLRRDCRSIVTELPEMLFLASGNGIRRKGAWLHQQLGMLVEKYSRAADVPRLKQAQHLLDRFN